MVNDANLKHVTYRSLAGFSDSFFHLVKQNFCLVGLMGSGKTTLAYQVASVSDFAVIDLDKLIEEAAGISINKIFKQKGEQFFRNLEYEVLEKKLASIRNSQQKYIISIGGGAFVQEGVRKLLTANDIVTVFIDVPVEIIAKRLKKDLKRPLLKNLTPQERLLKLQNLSESRLEFYNMCDIKIKFEGSSKLQSTALFLKEIKRWYEK